MPVARRSVLGAGVAAAVAALTGCARPARSAAWRSPAEGVAATAGPEVTGSAVPSAGAAPSAGATQAGYPPRVTEALRKYLVPTAEHPKHPIYPGAVAYATVNGAVTVQTAVGDALRYGAGPQELPVAQRVPMRVDSIFDLASITKVYTAILLLQQVERGRVDLAAPVVEYLPTFAGPGKSAVTVRMLLTHTSGLPVGPAISGLPDAAARRAAVPATPLVAGAVPGTVFRYSSTGLMLAAQIVEQVTGQSLESALRTGITGPLGLRYTGFTPTKWLGTGDRAKLVATDARSSRGLLRGVVHDEVCNSIGGVAGHAGIFSTAADLAVVGQALLGGGQVGGRRILAEATVRQMLVNANPGLPAVDPERPNRTSDHGLGVVLHQPWFMGRLSSGRTFGHTGFTGTSLLVDPARKLVLVVLTNRAHPNWSWSNPDPARVAVANAVADGMR